MTELKNLEQTVAIIAFIYIRLLQLREVMSLQIYLQRKEVIGEIIRIESLRYAPVFVQDGWNIFLQHYKTKAHDEKIIINMSLAYKSLVISGLQIEKALYDK